MSKTHLPELPDQEQPPGDLTQLLQTFKEGDRAAFDLVYQAVYRQIHVLAKQRMSSSGDRFTINTTGLVHESYLRLIDSNALNYKDFGHFFATASRVMRNIIIDSVRSRKSAKRGSGLRALTIEHHCIASEDQAGQLYEIDRQLTLLENHDERLARLIELRFFGGLTEPEAAEVLNISVSTVRRDWIRAKAWFQLQCSTEI